MHPSAQSRRILASSGSLRPPRGRDVAETRLRVSGVSVARSAHQTTPPLDSLEGREDEDDMRRFLASEFVVM